MVRPRSRKVRSRSPTPRDGDDRDLPGEVAFRIAFQEEGDGYRVVREHPSGHPQVGAVEQCVQKVLAADDLREKVRNAAGSLSPAHGLRLTVRLVGDGISDRRHLTSACRALFIEFASPAAGTGEADRAPVTREGGGFALTLGEAGTPGTAGLPESDEMAYPQGVPNREKVAPHLSDAKLPKIPTDGRSTTIVRDLDEVASG